MDQLMLCVDVGTGSVKTACVGVDGTIEATADQPLTTTYPEPGAAEQDPEALWQAVLCGCQEVLDQVGRDRIVGVGVCSQYSSIVPVDRDARPTMNMVTWQDKRGSPVALREHYPAAKKAFHDNPWRQLRWLRIHGVPPLPSGIDSLGHMRFIRFARPDAYAKTAAFLEPMDYVAARFTGRLASNTCSSFMSLLTDNRRGGWSDKLTSWSGVEKGKLPELLDVNEPVAPVRRDVADALGIRPDVVVHSTMNDTHAGGMASHAFEGDHAGLAIGTTGVIVAQVPFKKTDIRHAIVTTPSPVSRTNFVLAENGMAGKAVAHFLDKLVFADDGFHSGGSRDRFAALHAAIDGVPAGARGVLFLPWLTGSLTPSENPHMRGGFLNVSLETNRADLALAVLEGVAYNFRWLLETVERFAGRRIARLLFYGGGARSDAWAQILADVLGRPVHAVAQPRFAACLGVGLTGFHRAGVLRLNQFAGCVKTRRVFEPNAQHRQVYDLMHGQFVQAHRRNRPIFKALNQRPFPGV